MVECPRCGRRVDELQPLPPAVVTPELMETIGHEERGDVEACVDCVEELTERE